MKYADTKVDEAVSLLPTKKDGKDKRRAPRRDIRTTISIMTTHSFQAELRDLSARGVRLFVKDPIESGTQFTLNLPSKPGTSRSPLICQVVHCRKQPDGGYMIGAEFVGSVQYDPDANAQSARIRASILD